MGVLQVRIPSARPIKAVRQSIEQYCGEADADVVYKGEHGALALRAAEQAVQVAQHAAAVHQGRLAVFSFSS